MPDFKVINMNNNIDDCCYMPADTISDSDVCNSSVGPLAIIMLVTFLTVASNFVNSVFDSANAHSTFLVTIVLLMLMKGSRAMDPEEIHKTGDFSAAAAGFGIGLALIAGATVRRGSASDQTRKRKAHRPLGDTGTSPGLVPRLNDDLVAEDDVPSLTACSDSDDEDGGVRVGKRHSNTKGQPGIAGVQHDATVSVPVLAVDFERDHAMSSHTALYRRCATCHRQAKCDPVNCDFHLGLAHKVRT